MGIKDIFSKRQRLARGELPDVYVYDALPTPLRVQIVHIIRDAVGSDRQYSNLTPQVYDHVNQTLCREYGLFDLTQYPTSPAASVLEFFLGEKSVERALDVVELFFQLIQTYIAEDEQYKRHVIRKLEPEAAVEELNLRFKEHGIGYQFESGEIIRVDSELIHSEVVKPTLALLRDKHFKGANEEFLKAHEHYRHGRYKECLVDSLKAFESTMKSICNQRGWKTQPTDTAKNLINTCISNGLFPTYFETQFSSLRSLLESGVPTVRNKNGGHGQGTESVVVPEYLARYALNLTATTILFMVEAHEAKK